MADLVRGSMVVISSMRTVTLRAFSRMWRMERAMSGAAREAVAT